MFTSPAKRLSHVLPRALLAASLLLSGCLGAHRTEQHRPEEQPPPKSASASVSSSASAAAVSPNPPHPAANPTATNPASSERPVAGEPPHTAAQGSVGTHTRPRKARPRAPAANPEGSAPSAAAHAPAPTAVPTLDLSGLEQRLRDTSAIGIFAKLTLKNQVDDLLNRFRLYHGGHSDIKLEQLRQSYDLLLLKVLSLLQTKDALLARDISASREAIWNILIDPKKFAAISE